MADPTQRIYAMPDEDLHNAAQTMHDNLNDDLALFTPKFPFVTAGYVTSFQSDIDTAKAYQLDSGVTNFIKLLTSNVGTVQDQGADALDDLDSYAKLAYKTDLISQRIFGQNTWAAAKVDADKMVDALEEAHNLANQAPFKAAIIAKGYSQGEIDNLLTISQNLNTKIKLQKDAQSKRPISTQTRAILNNALYGRMQDINVCAGLVFKGNGAKLNQYRLTEPVAAVITKLIITVKDALGALIEGANVLLPNAPQFQPKTTDALGVVTFSGNSLPENVDIHVDAPPHAPTDQMNNPILPQEDNDVEVVVNP
ncbi:MAG: hypothetical protein NTX03_14875 [Bacteroidetes bacterium]|nr:hypothetical protein [Bacteroidota bacterium]